MKKITKIFFSLIFLILGSFLFSHSASAQVVTTYTYSGIIYNGENIPVHGIQLQLSNDTNRSTLVTTGSDGSFSLQVPSGSYSLSVVSSSVDSTVVPTQLYLTMPVTITADTVQNLIIPTQVLTVSALDSSGNPITNGYVTLLTGGGQIQTSNITPVSLYPGGPLAYPESPTSTSVNLNSSGVASIPFLPSDSAVLTLYPTGLSSVSETIGFSGAMSVTISTPPNLTYSGIVYNGANIPAKGVQVELSNSVNNSGVVTTGPDGSFSLVVPSGSYDLSLASASVDQSVLPTQLLLTTSNTPITVTTNTVQNLTIPTQLLMVTALDSSGNPISNGNVTILASSNRLGSIIPSFSLYPGGPQVLVENGVMQASSNLNSSGTALIPYLPSSSDLLTLNPTGQNSVSETINFSGAMNVIIPNQPPVVNAIAASPNPVQINNAVNTSANFTDINSGDTHTAVWDWGDGNTSSGTVTEPSGSIPGNVSGSHTYTTLGVYTVKLTVTDNNGGTGTQTFQYISVYDSSTSFAGGKSYDNPSIATPNTPGKISFGITAKYDNTNTLTGSVKMSFKSASISFASSALTSLATLNGKAYLKGSGTFNNVSGYTFLATGIDGSVVGGSDMIRIQIKDPNGSVVYDSQPSASDTVDPTTLVITGNIRIH